MKILRIPLHRRFPRLGIALAAMAMGMGAIASEPVQYRLVVGIVVDGLEGEWLQMLAPHMGEGGFRRLQSQGVEIQDLDYGTNLDATAAAALLGTGAPPAINGIAAATEFDPLSQRVNPVFADNAVMGNFSALGYSPAALTCSSLGDEIRIASGGLSGLYSVAADPSVAVAMGGHAANLALWINRQTGQWASSTYYREIPAAIAARNRTAPLESRLDTMSWTPLGDTPAVPNLPAHLGRYPFRYIFPRGADRLERFAASPLANTEVTRMALDLAYSVSLGQHSDGIDVLNVAYNLQPFGYGRTSDTRPETIDAYLRLDRDIATLISTLETRTGAPVLVYLAGTPPRPSRRRDEERWNLPGGEFSPRRAASLLNLYLIALHGNGDYVDGFHNGYFYLNRRLLKERNLDEPLIRRQAAEFLRRMTGVAEAYSIDEILAADAGNRPEALRRNTSVAHAGDVLVRISPGYEITDSPSPDGDNRLVQRLAPPTAPAFIMAPSVTPAIIGTVTDARTLAPTVARILRIRSPNGAETPPLTL